MSRFRIARIGFAAPVLLLPALSLSMPGCGSSQTQTGTTIQTTQAEQDEIDAQMRANEAELNNNKKKR